MKRTLAVLSVVTVSAVLCSETAYNEKYRPQYHFSPAKNWTNDPCGLVYAFGRFHLFFQHNPFANVWGNMSWGHASSPDLVHWKELPVAITADSKAAIFTGSSVVDANNSSGLCRSGKSCIVSIYTGYSEKTATQPERQTQNLAASDDGVTWTKYAGNPVLDLGMGDTRDPKVFWHAPTQRWVMVIVQADEKKIRLFSSRDLKKWEQLSEFGPQGGAGGQWECPDLFPLADPANPSNKHWILKIGLNPGHLAGGSGEQYFVGQFDGTRFKNDNPPDMIRWVDYGRDSYCELTFNNDPKPARPHMIGWMSNWQYAKEAPTAPWRGAMTIPRTITLTAGADGALTLQQAPADELKALRSEQFTYRGNSEAKMNEELAGWRARSQSFELDASIALGSAKAVSWKLLQGQADEVTIDFDAGKQELSFDRSRCKNCNFSARFPSRTVAPVKLGGNDRLRLHVFVDHSSVEIFAQDGKAVMTNLVYPDPASTGAALQSSGGTLQDIDVKLWNLKSAWPAAAK